MTSQQSHMLVLFEDLSVDEVNGSIQPQHDNFFLSTPISYVQRGLPDIPDAPLPLLTRNRNQDSCMYPTNTHVPRRIRLAPRSTHRSSNEFPIFPF
mmetsp:Transcript_7925/g.12059  ORF Transcript_7925/g.12059 Transcript_7925/m.12059 type:complete len:96 (+) Transcript_7925:73-360(+)